MNFDWSEYLNLADRLVLQKDLFANEEACYRSAISRAYYAAFCAARNRARDIESLAVNNTGIDHQLVKDHYWRAPDRPRQKIGAWLDRLRTNRNQADYEDRQIGGAVSLCQSSLDQARNVLNALKSL